MQLITSLKRPVGRTVFTALAAVFLMLSGCDGKGHTQQQTPTAAPPAQEVSVITVESRSVTLTTELPGRTTAYRVAEVRPQVNGLIKKRLFTEGTDVKEGDLLYQIDPASFQAALDNAKATLEKAKANLPALKLRVERYEELLKQKAVSRQDYDDATATLKQAEAEVIYCKTMIKSARINLAYTRITAPISGRIGRSSITEGAIVTAYQPTALATIQQLDPIYVDVAQSTADLLKLKRRMGEGRLNRSEENQNKVRLILEDGTQYSQEGVLQFYDVAVDPTTGSVTLRIVFPNPEGMLLPSMFVRAVVQEGVSENAILIPQQAVARDNKGNPVVHLVDNENKVQQKTLVLDHAIKDQWLVSSGLHRGDRIIVEGIQKVRPGATVHPVAYPSGQAPQSAN